MSLSTDRNVTAHISIVFVFLQEVVSQDKDLTQPFQDFSVVDDLMLYELL